MMGEKRAAQVITVQSSPQTTDDEVRMRALESALAEERTARAVAEAESNAKSALLATVSREVRTPLGAIISMADLLLATSLDSHQHRYVETLQQSGRALLAVLSEVLDHSKLEAGRFEMQLVPFDFIEVINSVEKELIARADQKGLFASVELADDFPQHMRGDLRRSNGHRGVDSKSISINIEL